MILLLSFLKFFNYGLYFLHPFHVFVHCAICRCISFLFIYFSWQPARLPGPWLYSHPFLVLDIFIELLSFLCFIKSIFFHVILVLLCFLRPNCSIISKELQGHYNTASTYLQHFYEFKILQEFLLWIECIHLCAFFYSNDLIYLQKMIDSLCWHFIFPNENKINADGVLCFLLRPTASFRRSKVEICSTVLSNLDRYFAKSNI